MKYLLLFISLIFAIFPIGLIGYYFYNKDTIKEPKKLLVKLFISGIISGLIVLFISIYGIILFPKYTQVENIKNIIVLFFYCFIFVATIEEFSKFLMIYFISYNNKEFDQAFDIVLYSVIVGLGFACLENIFYVIFKSLTPLTVLLRGITAVPAHVCFQIIMGYYLYLSKNKDKYKNLILGILIPIILHGTYDFFIYSKNGFIVLSFIFLLIFFVLYAYSKLNKLIEVDKSNLKTICPKCGNIIRYQYCPKCGLKKQ